ncbi:unnamed protein product [Peniophora sp. CBMAI 1063]|nr:unnamed protein product [Peniophora sp. CBMAI 1063]
MLSSSSSSSASPVSTAPSTPPPGPSQYLALGQPSVLKKLGSQLEEGDRILYVSGASSPKEVSDALAKAREIAGLASVQIDGTTGVKSELVPPATAYPMFSNAGLTSQIRLPVSSALNVDVLYRPPFTYPTLAATPANPLNPTAHPFGIPSREDWEQLWKTWDTVTLGMIPREMLHVKPIDLRHICLFYLGHIPTFLDMVLSKELGEPNTEPKWFTEIFERGIDPHVDDPEHCHRHSVVPTKAEDWPTLEDIITFRTRVRDRTFKLYEDLESGKRTIYRRLGRVLMCAYEHEAWHVETLLYMLIQRAGTGTLPPPGFPTPLFPELAKQWATIPPPTEPTVTLGPAEVTLGWDDQESDDLLPELKYKTTNRGYGWDNESPARTVHVGAFRASWRPVSNGEYLAWWRTKSLPIPASWVEEDGEIMVRTAFGPVGMDVAEQWPVMAAYDHMEMYAKGKGGRLPTEAELRLFLDSYNTGYEEDGNVGFRNWHPVPSNAGIDGKRGTNGGVWEWTSTKFDRHDGFDPTTIFSGYSSDFFDNVHQVVLGGSYATIPRQAGRRTARNFYQHNYPYAWVSARVVFDVEA